MSVKQRRKPIRQGNPKRPIDYVWKERDPIALFETLLREASLLTDADLSALESDIAAELDEAVAVAEAGPLEPLEDLLKDVYTPTGA